MSVITNAEQKKEIALVQRKVNDIVTKAEDYKVIKSQKQLEEAIVVLGEVGERQKLYKARIEGDIIAPIKQGLNNLLAFVKPLKDRLAYAEALVKDGIYDYRESLKKKETEKGEELTKKVEAGEMNVHQAAEQLEKIERKSDVIPVRKVRDIEITNQKLIPAEYWVIDMVALRRDALAAGAPEIPGVKVIIREIIVKQ